MSPDVSYAQIALFHSAMQDPFNDWSDRHVAQGFAWRPGSVSFRTLDADGRSSVSVKRAKKSDLSPSALRAIRVPFTVKGGLEIATISSSIEVDLKVGEYLVTCEQGRNEDGSMWCTFLFVPGTGPAAVLRADSELSPEAELLMVAQPATS